MNSSFLCVHFSLHFQYSSLTDLLYGGSYNSYSFFEAIMAHSVPVIASEREDVNTHRLCNIGFASDE